MDNSSLDYLGEPSAMSYDEIPNNLCSTIQHCSQSGDLKYDEIFPKFSVPDYSDSSGKMIDQIQADLKSSLENSLKINLKETLKKKLACSTAKPS